MNHEEMVKYTNTHTIKQRKGINTNHTMYNVENTGRLKRDQKMKQQTYFIDTWVIFPTVTTQLPQESISSLIQRPGAKDLLVS